MILRTVSPAPALCVPAGTFRLAAGSGVARDAKVGAGTQSAGATEPFNKATLQNASAAEGLAVTGEEMGAQAAQLAERMESISIDARNAFAISPRETHGNRFDRPDNDGGR